MVYKFTVSNSLWLLWLSVASHIPYGCFSKNWEPFSLLSLPWLRKPIMSHHSWLYNPHFIGSVPMKYPIVKCLVIVLYNYTFCFWRCLTHFFFGVPHDSGNPYPLCIVIEPSNTIKNRRKIRIVLATYPIGRFPKRRYPQIVHKALYNFSISNACAMVTWESPSQSPISMLVGGVYLPLWKRIDFVNWDD